MRQFRPMSNTVRPMVKRLKTSMASPMVLLACGVALAALAPMTASAAPPAKDLSVTYPPISRALIEGKLASIETDRAPIGRFVAAPMPNQDASAPRILGDAGPNVGPSMFQGKKNYRGDGFTPDSSPQINQQSRRVSLPGISLKVPLY